MDPAVLWAIVGVIVAVIGVIVAIIFGVLGLRNPFKKPDTVELGPETLKKVGMPNAVKGMVGVAYFPTGSPALELTNLSSTGVRIASLCVSTDLMSQHPVETYPLAAPVFLIARERSLVYISPFARKFFESHLGPSYLTGKESRKPSIRIWFRFESGEEQLETESVTLIGSYRNKTLVDLKPA